MSNVVEIVTFKLAEGYSSQDFLQNNEQMNQFFNDQEGMMYRSLCETDEGKYIDIVYWDSIKSAEKGQAAFHQSPLCEAFAQCIDNESVKLEHVKVIASHGCSD